MDCFQGGFPSCLLLLLLLLGLKAADCLTRGSEVGPAIIILCQGTISSVKNFRFFSSQANNVFQLISSSKNGGCFGVFTTEFHPFWREKTSQCKAQVLIDANNVCLWIPVVGSLGEGTLRDRRAAADDLDVRIVINNIIIIIIIIIITISC